MVKKKKSKLEKLEKRIIKRFLKKEDSKKSSAKLKGINPEKFITKGLGKQPLVSEGETGYFKKEYEGEVKWLS